MAKIEDPKGRRGKRRGASIAAFLSIG